jgi:hypothetical protein
VGTKQENIAVFIIAVLIAGGIYVWFHPLNKGTLTIISNQEAFSAIINEKTLHCSDHSCNIPLKVGSYQLLIQKKEYAPIAQKIQIERGKNKNIQINLKKIVKLEISNITPQETEEFKGLPSNFSAKTIAFTWNNKKTKVLFLDQEDERLKIWNGETDQIITNLKNIVSPLKLIWSINEKYILAYQGKEAYFINTVNGSRKKKKMDFEITVATINPKSEDVFLNSHSANLYQIPLSTFSDLHINNKEITINLSQSEWIDDETLLYFTANEKTRSTSIQTYNFKTDIITTLIIKFDFLAQQIKWDSANKTAFFRGDDSNWYKLRIIQGKQ